MDDDIDAFMGRDVTEIKKNKMLEDLDSEMDNFMANKAEAEAAALAEL